MSYDFFLNPSLTGEAPLPKDKLAEALRSFDSTLEVSRIDWQDVLQRMPEMPAVLRDHFSGRQSTISLNGDQGVQISLYDGSGAITLPYLHDSETARLALERIWDYLKILNTVGALSVHDPQLHQNLDLNLDFPQVLAKYLKNSVLAKGGIRLEPEN